MHESFSLWGKPTLGASPLAELSARSASGGASDLVTGRVVFGVSTDREWYTCGRFSLMRAGAAEEMAQQGDAAAGDAETPTG